MVWVQSLLLLNNNWDENRPFFLLTHPYTALPAISSAPSLQQMIFMWRGSTASIGMMHLSHDRFCRDMYCLNRSFHASMSSSGIGSSQPRLFKACIATFLSTFIGSVIPLRSQWVMCIININLFVHRCGGGQTDSRSSRQTTGMGFGGWIPRTFLWKLTSPMPSPILSSLVDHRYPPTPTDTPSLDALGSGSTPDRVTTFNRNPPRLRTSLTSCTISFTSSSEAPPPMPSST